MFEQLRISRGTLADRDPQLREAVIEALAAVRFHAEEAVDRFLENEHAKDLAQQVTGMTLSAKSNDIFVWIDQYVIQTLVNSDSFRAEVVNAFERAGHDLIACDITDLRFVSEPLVLADGASLPFNDASFDAALLSTVLHHAPAESHAAMLSEEVRVLRPGGRLLVLEDIYRNAFERATNRFVDAITNAQLFGEPHSNRTLEAWIELANKLGLKLVHTSEFFAWFGIIRIRQALLVIERG